jgi:hypothetical protein
MLHKRNGVHSAEESRRMSGLVKQTPNPFLIRRLIRTEQKNVMCLEMTVIETRYSMIVDLSPEKNTSQI